MKFRLKYGFRNGNGIFFYFERCCHQNIRIISIVVHFKWYQLIEFKKRQPVNLMQLMKNTQTPTSTFVFDDFFFNYTFWLPSAFLFAIKPNYLLFKAKSRAKSWIHLICESLLTGRHFHFVSNALRSSQDSVFSRLYTLALLFP